MGNSAISESDVGYLSVVVNKDDILFATYNDWVSGKAVVKKYDKTTGIENVFQDDMFKVYPNPVKDRLSIELTGQKFKVMVSDINGRLFYENTNGYNKIEIDANAFDKGVFIVKVRSDGGTFHYRKLIVL